MSGNNNTLINITTTSTPQPQSDNSFCITCGFDFGHIVDGIDDKIAGALLISLFVLVICCPCIIMSYFYLFRNKNKKKKKKKSKYHSVEEDKDDDDDADNSDLE
jgi:hypothetical protein